MKNYLFTVIASSLLGLSMFGQARELDVEEDDFQLKTFWQRVYTGGNVSFQIVNQTTFFDVSPIVGYSITKDFSAGVGLKYSYIGFNGIPRYSTSMYGSSIFARYLFLKNFLAHTEFEMINREVFQPFSGEYKREWVPICLVGGGYRQSVGGNSYIQIMLLYDIIGDQRSPYLSPFGLNSRLYVRGGITIGF